MNVLSIGRIRNESVGGTQEGHNARGARLRCRGHIQRRDGDCICRRIPGRRCMDVVKGDMELTGEREEGPRTGLNGDYSQT